MGDEACLRQAGSTFKMKVIIHTMFEKLYEDEATEVVLPGEDGEFSVLDFHQPSIYALKKGCILIIPRVSVSSVSRKVTQRRLEIKIGIADIGTMQLNLSVEV